MRPTNKINLSTGENEQDIAPPQPPPSRTAWFFGAILVVTVTITAGTIYLGQHWRWNKTDWDFQVEVASTQSNMTFTFADGTQMDFILIPAGEFTMGSPKGEVGGESWEPQRRVIISKPFYMGICEVTQAQYKAVMGENPSQFGYTHQNPVDYVSWDDAVEFCRKLSAKTNREVNLPTEAQWEYACRAGTTTPFNVGETISTDHANYDGRETYGKGTTPSVYLDRTSPTGIFKPNGFGLYDMHGNVAEWCRDCFRSYLPAKTDGIDPENTIKTNQRVYRGGSWFDKPEDCRSAARLSENQKYRDSCLGFRVIVSPVPSVDTRPAASQKTTGIHRITYGMPLSVAESMLIGIGSERLDTARRFGSIGHYEGDPDATCVQNLWYALPGKTLIALAGERLIREPDNELTVSFIYLGETGKSDNFYNEEYPLQYLVGEAVISKAGIVGGEKMKVEHYEPAPTTQKHAH